MRSTPRIRLLSSVFVSTSMAFGCNAAYAETAPTSYVRRPIPAIRTSVPPIIGGDLSDVSWKTAARAQTFLDQQRGTIAPDQTEAYLLYDANYIYVGFYCHDGSPDQIVARETVRDMSFGHTEDNVEVTFDTFLSHVRTDFARFSVNPLGTRAARIAGGRANKAEWKGDWDAAAKRVADGWTAELRIPWASLNYPRRKQPVNMGINFRRWQQHTRTQSVWSNVGPQGFDELEGVWTQVQVPSTAFHPRLSLLPYTLSGLGGQTAHTQFGMDARYALSPQLTSVASINPDFSTVQSAVESITFSRSEQYVRETRPFFLEGGSYFNSLSAGSLLFYSNRIQAFDTGVKLYGKLTPQDTLGFLNTIQFGERDDTVMNLRHSLSPTASANLFFSRMSAVGDNNTVGQVSADSRWGKLGAAVQWADSTGRSAGGDARSLDLGYDDKHFSHSLEYLDYGRQFRAADGLVPFTDLKGFDAYEAYHSEWLSGFWQSMEVSGGGQYQWHQNGTPFERGDNLDVRFDARKDWTLGLHAGYNRFDDQTDNMYGFDFTSGLSNPTRRWGVLVLTGRQTDRASTLIRPQFSVRLFRRLDLNYGGTVQYLGPIAAQHVVTMNYQISPTRALVGRIVANNSAVNAYVSFHNSGERGTNYYVILGDPNAPRFVKSMATKVVFSR